MLNKVCKISLSSLSAVLILGVEASFLTPMLVAQPATAAVLAQARNQILPSGTIIPLREPNNQRIIVTPDETATVTLVTARAVRSRQGNVIIPRGTRVRGQFRPTDAGTAFYAEEIELNNGDRSIQGRTNVVNNRRTVKRGTNTDPIWQGALVGGGAATVISALVTRPGIFKTLAGAGAGALAGWLIGGRSRESAEVIVVGRNNILELQLSEDLFVDRNRF
jgi:hypothetical protein